MNEKIIKIEFKEPLDLNINEENNNVFKRHLVEQIKEILNAADIEDFYVYEQAGSDIQEIILMIDNKKSDH